MRMLIFAAGSIVSALGFMADAMINDPEIFQGALTLGGGWIICGLFSFSSKWHGYIGAGVLALLGAGTSITKLPGLFQGSPAAPFQATAFVLCLVVLIGSVRALTAERRRRQIAELETEDPDL